MKRSKMIHLALLGSVGTLSGCGSDTEAIVYDSVQQCVAAQVIDAKQCETEYGAAQRNHEQTAPRFTSLSSCETDFGAGRCSSSSGGFFIPFMAGYMVSSALNRGFGPGNTYQSQPLYRTRSDTAGSWRTAGNDTVRGSGRVTVDSNVAKPSTRAVTMSRSGFGSTASARGSWGG